MRDFLVVLIFLMYNDDTDKEEFNMAEMVDVSFEIEEDLLKDMEQICKNEGLSVNDAFTLFAESVAREHCIPFELPDNL